MCVGVSMPGSITSQRGRTRNSGPAGDGYLVEGAAGFLDGTMVEVFVITKAAGMILTILVFGEQTATLNDSGNLVMSMASRSRRLQQEMKGYGSE